ncbi:tRNA (adenine(22)-N(1))-methyltransferase [Pseudoalteromonas umbrosa]|uniref:tRNA (adenine(22)-N(1))-methyltransferase n=1 Tax=Pseudoalteromonas umbrosa TaxID=3048489 RepID=UPI0024C335ED|nr:tRNA (adenine(22)-N(1))-methyltransferase TrmK [Pseudoalteromonas sp. B95]MDK1285849.1 tRNA (adenine(22)-N(1))-methyltransferase TrmK [Pseudoalteromonas sp. B95]
MKLGKRLAEISQLVDNQYTHIWDCCCDHGFLGANLLDKNLDATVHFVDIVPHLMEALDTKLPQFYADKQSQWQTHCMDVSELPLEGKSGKHLVIIAGVGGDLCGRFIRNILANNPSSDIDFLLCPVHHLYTLRQALNHLNLNLINETLISENKRYYEILKVTNDLSATTRSISSVGEAIWQYSDAQSSANAKAYLNKTIAHYQRINRGDNDVSDIIAAYEGVKVTPRN